MQTFAGIETFVRVVETGSFTAAAAKLQTAKSSVSEAIRALEERLGVRLLDRTTRRVRPTEAGLAYYARCRRLIEDAAEAHATAQAVHEAPAGQLRIAAPEGLARRYLVPSLSTFFATYPTIGVELVEATASARLVDEGLDLAIRISPAPEPSLVVKRLGRSEVVIVASPAYLAAAGTPTRAADVAHHACIGFAPLAWRDSWRIGGETIAIRPRLVSNGTESMRAAALAGLGLVALPDWLVTDALAAGQLTRVLADQATPVSGIYAVYPSNRMIAPKVRAFVDHVARYFRARGLKA